MKDTTTSVETTVWLPVSPAEAFELVTRPDRLRRWLIVAGRIDLRIGGDVHLVVAPGAHAVGTVTEIEPGRRFSYTHGWVGDEALPPGSSEVTVELQAREGGTSVVICHRGLPEGATGGMQEGWNDFAERLSRTGAGTRNGRDWPPAQELSSPASVLDSTLFALLDTLRTFDPQDLSRQTPCDEYTVQDLAQHLIDNATMLGQALSRPDPDVPPDGDLEDQVASALWPCVEAAQALPPERETDLGGATVTTDELVKYLSVEFLVHAWDIAQATDSELDTSPELHQVVLEYAQQTRSTPFVTDDTFKPATPASAADKPLDQLLALTGRTAEND